MQIYKTTYKNEDGAVVTSWQASQTEASKTRSQIKRDGYGKPETATVNIPTAKGPLIDWLNENVTA